MPKTKPFPGKPVKDQRYAKGCAQGVPQSDLVCPRDFLQSWDLKALEAIRLKTDLDAEAKLNQIAKKMKVDEDTIKELSQVCGPENLFCGDEPSSSLNLISMTEVPEGVNLKSVNHQIRQRELRNTNSNIKTAFWRHMKYRYIDEFWFNKAIEGKSPPPEPQETVPTPNVVITVEVTKCRFLGAKEHKLPLSETFILLGTQSLSDLKDAIKCPSDSIVAGDFSAMPDMKPSRIPNSKELYKSGFFFIENTFYNDVRHDDNKDYSKPIRAWAEVNWPECDLEMSDMEGTQFLDLSFRLGHYYLFTHQGNCEHSLQFQDLRLFTSEDIQDLSLYPVRMVERVKSRKLCQGCTKLSAKWIVFDSPLIPTDPCFLCQTCLKSLLYTPDGEKTSNFKAHHYSEYFA